MISLDRRLQSIYDKIDDCDRLCDCGCDHGKVIVKALVEGRAKQGVAIDVSAPSLSKAINLAAEYAVDDRLTALVANGLSSLDTVCDNVVIAGMGAQEIINILSAQLVRHKRYILLPHNYPYRLRRYLYNSGYRMQYDRVIRENDKYYHLICVGWGEASYDERDLYIGADNRTDDPVFRDYVKYRSNVLSSILRYNERDADLASEYEYLKKYSEVI